MNASLATVNWITGLLIPCIVAVIAALVASGRLNNWRRRVFEPACAAAGIQDLRVHDLRHTAASLAIAAGANVKAVQQMLGHASAAMTLDVYAGLFPDDLDAVGRSLDAHVPQMCHNGLAPGVGRVALEGRNAS